MKKIFLTSNLGLSEKQVDGTRISIPINNKNNIVDRIKENLDNEDTILFFVSNPDDYLKNDMYANVTFEGFNKSGFNFKNLVIIDNRYKGSLKEDIEKADLIFLGGGNTLTQMEFFEKIGLRELLKDYDKVIIGQSAGSLNLAKTVVCSPEYLIEVNGRYIWNGLGLTDINIEPHFVTSKLVNEEDIILREELLKLSLIYPIYAIVDGTDIFDDGITQTMYGEGYLIENRKIEKLSNVGEKVEISSNREV